MQGVRDAQVWNHIRIAFAAAGLLFFINNFFGFDNVATYPAIPFWQILVHLHAGTLGWITLSVIGFAVWIYTGDREVSIGYVRNVKLLVWGAIAAFALYIPFFAIAFSQGQPYFMLMAVFGTFALAMIWAALVYSFVQARNQYLLTTPHLLMLGGFLVVSVGSLMGVLLDVEFTMGQIIPVVVADRVGIHAGMNDTYLFLAAAAIVEFLVLTGPARRWTGAGAGQAAAWTIAGLAVPSYFLTGINLLLMIFVILLLVGLALFVVRTARHALTRNPLRGGVAGWMFVGTLWFIAYVFLFIYAAVAVLPNEANAPSWFPAIFAHVPYVGMMTNLILGLFSARTQGSGTFRLGEPIAQWLINLGILAFFLSLVVFDSALGAVIMGVGVVLGVVTMLSRLFSKGAAEPALEGAVHLPVTGLGSDQK